MLVVLWIALAIAVVAPTWGLVRAVRAGLRAWRDFRELSRSAAAALAELTRRLEHFAERTGAAPAHARELEQHGARLRLSLARLAVLRAAVDEATDVPRRLTALYPRK